MINNRAPSSRLVVLAEPVLLGEAARRLRVPERRLRDAAQRGRIRAEKVGQWYWALDMESARAFANEFHRRAEQRKEARAARAS